MYNKEMETTQTKQLFIALNKSQDKLKTLEHEVETIRRKNKVEIYSFIPNSFLKNINKIDSFGNLEIEWNRRASDLGCLDFPLENNLFMREKRLPQKWLPPSTRTGWFRERIRKCVYKLIAFYTIELKINSV
jgi:hypothetical protein